MADLDLNTVPFVPSTDVSLIDPGTGRPKTAMHDWMFASQQWMSVNVTNLKQRVTTVESETGQNSSKVTQIIQALTDGSGAYGSYILSIDTQTDNNTVAISNEVTARTTADSAIATDVTNLTATVATVNGTAVAAQSTAVNAQNLANGATASGQVYIAARTAPGGATAAYGWYLTAGGSYAGMEAIALSGGGSAIGFTANQFMFTDSGTAQPVLAYDGSSFVFQVPVIIRSGTTGERTEQTPKNTKIYDGAGTLRVALGIDI